VDVPDGLGIMDIPPQVLGNCAVQFGLHPVPLTPA
jgi:hypothetical protein